ncbi:hypothetical protein B0H14DRAFT_3153718 [Mycena olivaceomarginata]|nr:hypothetical protein B0H14DRAFT_3153718 [Mycena olivaceomarginata]
MSKQYEQWLIRPQSGTAMWLCEGTRAEGQVNEKKCDEKEKRQENKGQIGVHGGGNAEAKSACMEERECRGQIGVHGREGMQRPNRRAWRRGAAEAKSVSMEERECRGQISVHRGGMQRPNRRARRGHRDQIGVHRGGMQRPNRHAQRGDAEAKSACTEPFPEKVRLIYIFGRTPGPAPLWASAVHVPFPACGHFPNHSPLLYYK